MGCCGKKQVYTANHPAVFGDDVGESIQVYPTVSVRGLRPNVATWVRGSHVQTLLDAGWLVPV